MQVSSPTKPPLVRQELDTAECESPGCQGNHPVFMTAHCHRGAGIDVGYDRHTGCLNFYCHECKDFVCRVLVGEATVN